MSEQRLTDLEIKVAYQDQLLEELNEIIYQQQKKVDELVLRVNEMVKKLATDIHGEDEPPPHY